eukprot:2284043-Alexandrium_andersonii.AAC.1
MHANESDAGLQEQPTAHGNSGPQENSWRAGPISKATALAPSCLLRVAGKLGVGTPWLDGNNGRKSAHVARQETANWFHNPWP